MTSNKNQATTKNSKIIVFIGVFIVFALAVISAFFLPESVKSTKAIDLLSVFIGMTLLFFKKKIDPEWHKPLEYTAVMGPGAIILVEALKRFTD